MLGSLEGESPKGLKAESSREGASGRCRLEAEKLKAELPTMREYHGY